MIWIILIATFILQIIVCRLWFVVGVLAEKKRVEENIRRIEYVINLWEKIK